MSKFGLHGKLKATSGNGEVLAQILLEAATALKNVKGCQYYLVSKDSNDPDTVWVTEVWNTKEDHKQSLQLDSVKTLITKVIPILDEMPTSGLELDVLGGKGL